MRVEILHFYRIFTIDFNSLSLMKKYFAELIGTMVLVLLGCGAAVFAGAGQPFAPVGTLGVAFAFGLAVVAMAYSIGNISGCHINPAITFGAWISGRMKGGEAAMYMLFQVIGAVIGSAILWALAYGSGSTTTLTGANAFADGAMLRALVAEAVFTFIFVFVVLGATSPRAHGKFAGLAIGLTLVLVHIVCIPITGTSVNPARSIGPAVFEAVGGSIRALTQLWLFIVAPLVGGALAALVWRSLDTSEAA
jgi:aquaporin Z